jgi:hypothetical protein
MPTISGASRDITFKLSKLLLSAFLDMLTYIASSHSAIFHIITLNIKFFYKEMYYTDMFHHRLPLYGEQYIKISVFCVEFLQKSWGKHVLKVIF